MNDYVVVRKYFGPERIFVDDERYEKREDAIAEAKRSAQHKFDELEYWDLYIHTIELDHAGTKDDPFIVRANEDCVSKEKLWVWVEEREKEITLLESAYEKLKWKADQYDRVMSSLTKLAKATQLNIVAFGRDDEYKKKFLEEVDKYLTPDPEAWHGFLVDSALGGGADFRKIMEEKKKEVQDDECN